MIVLFIFLAIVVALALAGAGMLTIDWRRRRRVALRREQPATLEGGGSHLSADRRR